MAPTTVLPLEQATPRGVQPRPSLETGLLVGAALISRIRTGETGDAAV